MGAFGARVFKNAGSGDRDRGRPVGRVFGRGQVGEQADDGGFGERPVQESDLRGDENSRVPAGAGLAVGQQGGRAAELRATKPEVLAK